MIDPRLEALCLKFGMGPSLMREVWEAMDALRKVEEAERDRYFLVFYATEKSIANNVAMYSNGFINAIEVEKYVNTIHPSTTRIMITGVYEFANKKDFEDFTAQRP